MSKTNKLIRWLVAIWFMAFIINPCQSSADSAHKKQEQQETTSQPGLFLQQKLNDGTFNNQSLVILDLDDTTITTPEGQWLGRSEMFYYLVDKEMQRNPGRERQPVVADIDPLLTMVYGKVPVQLTDKTLPDTINRLISKGITVIGMTARGLPVADATRWQLKEVGITFSDTGTERFIALPGGRQSVIDHGVVLAGQGNKKGEVLIALIEHKLLPKPEQVMLVDDHVRHLDSVQQAVMNFDSGIAYVPVLCTYLKDKKRFDPVASEQQLLDFLYQWRNDKTVANFVEQDAYSQGFIAQCKAIPAREKQCRVLLKQFGLQADSR